MRQTLVRKQNEIGRIGGELLQNQEQLRAAGAFIQALQRENQHLKNKIGAGCM